MKIRFLRLLLIGYLAVLSIHISKAIDPFDGTENIVFASSSVELSDGDFAQGFVRFDDGFSVPAGEAVTLSIIPPVKGAINLNTTGKVVLTSDLFLASNATLPDGGVIDGQDNVLFLHGNLTIPRGKILKIAGNTIIDGQGHELIIEEDSGATAGGIINIDGPAGTTLTLRNITVKGLKDYTSSRGIKFGTAANQLLILDNAIINLADDFTFTGGGLSVANYSIIAGAHSFVFTASYDCTIEKLATLMLDFDVVFMYQPADRKKIHMVMTDQTSRLFFNGCTLKTPSTQGLILTKGHVIVDHKSYIDSSGASRYFYGVTFGDGREANNVFVDIMPAASLEIVDGILTYNNIDGEDVDRHVSL